MRFNNMDLTVTGHINRFKGGDESAFEEIVKAYQDRIYNLCRVSLGNPRDAEDAAQDVFIKVYQNLKKFDPAPSFSSWIYRIAVNTCIDYKRRPAAWRQLLGIFDEGREFPLDARSNLPSPEEMYESKKTGEAIRRGLSLISPKLRTVIVLKEIEGLSYEEIAGVLGISIGTVKSRIFRAREELRRFLSEKNGQFPDKLLNKKPT